MKRRNVIKGRRPVVRSSKALEQTIREKLETHLTMLGFDVSQDGSVVPASSSTKESIRTLHRAQRIERLRENEGFIKTKGDQLFLAFANGSEVNPDAVAPRLQLIEPNTWESDLFRLASLLWSVPVSSGYGRRLRFLVWDRSNEKLIGIMALGDPSFNLAARDSLIGWSSAERKERLVNIMDAFILGAVPPYNAVLGGKLVASLVRSREVVSEFRARYRNSVGLISRKPKHASLVAITTTSALGRSALYNRLSLAGVKYFEPIGYTGGWGHFHIPRHLFNDMRSFLELRDHDYAKGNRFGDGPNWRLRTIRVTLELLGYDPELLRHGVARQVFVSWLATNALRVLRGLVGRPYYSTLLPAKDIGALALDRWLKPRAGRDTSYSKWQRAELRGALEWQSQYSNPIHDGMAESAFIAPMLT
jgi:Domain of unknown function (DUF4338)